MLNDPSWDKKIVVDEVGQLMLKTADYFETFEWCQEVLVSDGAVCLLGGLIKVGNGDFKNDSLANQPEIVQIAYKRINEYLNEEPVDWNDDQERQKSEVISMLRKVAVLK